MATRPTAPSAATKAKPVAVAAAMTTPTGPQIIWTALPNGITGTGDQRKLKLSVFVSPRLKTGDSDIKDSLSKYADFIDWPAKVKGIQFSVAFEGGPTVEAMKSTPEPDSELWKALFKPAVPVKTFDFPDFHQRPILSYPVSHVQSFIRAKYLSVAAVPDMVAQLPNLEDLADYNMFGQIAFKPHPEYVAAAELRGIVTPPVNIEATLRQDLGQTLKAQRVIPSRVAPEPQKDFVQYMMYSDITAKKKFGAKPPELDFHRALSALGRFPQLMRKLGLVVDLEIPWQGAIPAGGSASTVKVIPKWSSQHAGGDHPMRTKYLLTDKMFAAATRPGGDIQNGMLKLSDPTYEVVQVDVESAAEKTMEFANNLTANVAFRKSYPQQEKTGGLPTLRSAGLSVIRKERDKKVFDHLQFGALHNQVFMAKTGVLKSAAALAALQADPEPAQYADDLMRGLRVDVWDSTTKGWHSLCRRLGTFEFLDSTSPRIVMEEEGFVSSVVAHPPGKGAPDSEVRLHEALFRWDGWSLCAQRPGKTIGPDDKPAYIENTPGPEFRLKTSFEAVPGSLPRLRFGTTYRMRARIVDLAGNSVGFDEPDPADFSMATIPATYSRYEPVPSPTLVLREDLKGQVGTVPAKAEPAGARVRATKKVAEPLIVWKSPGESVERLVIRSFNDAPAKDTQPSTQQSDRHVVPPKTPQQMAETHGMFDTPTGMKGKMFDSRSGQKDSYTTIAENDASLKDNGDKLSGAIEPAEQLEIPYLPDPNCLGAALYNLPGAAGVTKVDFITDLPWPEARPFRIKIAEGTGAPQWDAAKRVLNVLIPKAEIKTVLLSSVIPEKALAPMGIWNWLEEAAGLRPLSTTTLKAIEPKRESGSKVRLPTRLNFAPSSGGPLRLPTAGTKQPAPSAATPQAAPLRQAFKKGDVSALIMSTVPKIDTNVLNQIRQLSLSGRNWMVSPYREITLVHAVQQPMKNPELEINGGKGSIGDTFAFLTGKIAIHGKSTGKIDILAEWDEPIDPISEAKWRNLSGKAHVAEEIVQYGDNELEFKNRKHDFGDTKHRMVRYSPSATTRFREYFGANITSDPKNITRNGQLVEVNIHSSARPDAPRVVYVIPTFGWDTQQSGQTITRKRIGGGLRVYLERPWFSSGEGELLGVILPLQGGGILKTGPSEPVDYLKPYVTQWGMDPIWVSGDVHDVPKFEHFKKAVKTANQMSLIELPQTYDPKKPRVSVAGHAVEYDEARQLWYADIEVDAGPSYFPFVRLALVRYQPSSTADAFVSRVVVTDFAQLAPDRTATVTRNSAGQATVTVKGRCYSASPVGQGPSEMEVTVESRLPDSDPEIGWVPVNDTVFPLQKPTGVKVMLGGETVWTGTVNLPEPAGGRKYRVVVREYEKFIKEGGQAINLSNQTVYETDRRMVYADAFEI